MSVRMSQTPLRDRPLPSGHLQSGAPGFLWALVGIMAAIEIVLTASDAGLLGANDWRSLAYLYGAFWQPLVQGDLLPIFAAQPVTMYVTHAFLHGGPLHLAMNAVILLALGKAIAARIGTGGTLLVFLLSAVAGGAAFGLLSSSNGPMIGASGAAFGFFGLWNAWDLDARRRRGLPLQPVLGTVAGLVLANLALFVFLDGGLAWEAHLGGYVMGWLAGITFATGRR